MTVEYKQNRIILNLDENEFLLIASLISQRSIKTKKDNIVKNPVDVKMNIKLKNFILKELM